MHVLFVHQNFPAQFGHIASLLAQRHGFRCTFVSEKPAGQVGGIELIEYKSRGGARESTHYCSRTFENQTWHSAGVFEALQGRPDIQPDLVVGHAGFLSTLFLRELYDAPQITYFEFFYRPKDSDMDFRSDLPACKIEDRLRARQRNAGLLLDLENCDAGYSPTEWQRSRLPQEFRGKVSTIFDGIDTAFWKPFANPSRIIAGHEIPADTKVVTYVSRGMESIRGFDIFMKVAKRICDERADVVFLVAGEDRIAYGGDARFTNGETFRQWVLGQEDYDLNRIVFLGRVQPSELVQLFALSNLHIYLTVPFVLSWSLFNALACGATVLASDTGPVREIIENGETGLLTDFFDIDQWVARANEILNSPGEFRGLGDTGRRLIDERYSLDVCLPRMLALYQQVITDAAA